MEAILFLAADYANHEASGKLNVLGIFNQIQVREFPARHRRLYLVIRIAAQLGEYETKHDMKIVFFDQDGKELGVQQVEITIPRPDNGRQAVGDVIIEVSDLYLPMPGSYEFKLILNREVKSNLPIEVIQVNSPLSSDDDAKS